MVMYMLVVAVESSCGCGYVYVLVEAVESSCRCGYVYVGEGCRK